MITGYNLAQLNIAAMKEPAGSPAMAAFSFSSRYDPPAAVAAGARRRWP